MCFLSTGAYALLFLVIASYSRNDVSGAHTTVVQTKGQQQTALGPAPRLVVEQGKVPYNVTRDAEALSLAMIGIGTDEQAVIEVITGRTNNQRQMIRTEYQRLYQKDLMEDLKDDLSGSFESVIIALMTEPYDLLAKELHTSFSYLIASDDHTVDEILCTKSRDELLYLNQAYSELYGQTLNQSVSAATKGSYKNFLVKILTEPMRESRANQFTYEEAESLQETIPTRENDCGPHENVMLDDAMAKRPFEELGRAFTSYAQRKNRTVQDNFERWCADMKVADAYKTVASFAQSPAKFYAKEIYDAVMGVGTDDRKLIRIIVSRHEKDLDSVSKAYTQLYGTTLASSISKDTSGNYRTTLLSLIEE